MDHVDGAQRPRAGQFLPWVGKEVAIGGTDVVLTLTEVAEDRGAQFPGAEKGFILIFAAAEGATSVLAEGLHRCRFGDGPAHDIYVMPIHAGGAGRQLYQAVFN